jgi:hypothetical protein
MEFKCNSCNVSYKSNSGLWKHNLKYHNKNNDVQNKENNKTNQETEELKQKKYFCRKCNKSLSNRNSRWRHEKTCKFISNTTLQNKIKNLESKIDELSLKEINYVDNSNVNNDIKNKIVYTIAKIDDVNIITRREDNYIDGNFMCALHNKNFEDWFNLQSTTSLMYELSKLKKSNIADLFIKDKPFVWLCHELAIQLAQWLSSLFAIKISLWISEIDGKNNIINNQKNKIKSYENMLVKKQKRTQYSSKHVIYVLTNKFYKETKTFIIGKATCLTSRLSTYNKTIEHDVVYYRNCENHELLETAEKIILNKLDNFREQANRDRFVLPENLEVSFIIDRINNFLDYLNKPHQINQSEIVV